MSITPKLFMMPAAVANAAGFLPPAVGAGFQGLPFASQPNITAYTVVTGANGAQHLEPVTGAAIAHSAARFAAVRHMIPANTNATETATPERRLGVLNGGRTFLGRTSLTDSFPSGIFAALGPVNTGGGAADVAGGGGTSGPSGPGGVRGGEGGGGKDGTNLALHTAWRAGAMRIMPISSEGVNYLRWDGNMLDITAKLPVKPGGAETVRWSKGDDGHTRWSVTNGPIADAIESHPVTVNIGGQEFELRATDGGDLNIAVRGLTNVDPYEVMRSGPSFCATIAPGLRVRSAVGHIHFTGFGFELRNGPPTGEEADGVEQVHNDIPIAYDAGGSGVTEWSAGAGQAVDRKPREFRTADGVPAMLSVDVYGKLLVEAYFEVQDVERDGDDWRAVTALRPSTRVGLRLKGGDVELIRSGEDDPYAVWFKAHKSAGEGTVWGEGERRMDSEAVLFFVDGVPVRVYAMDGRLFISKPAYAVARPAPGEVGPIRVVPKWKAPVPFHVNDIDGVLKVSPGTSDAPDSLNFVFDEKYSSWRRGQGRATTLSTYPGERQLVDGIEVTLKVDKEGAVSITESPRFSYGVEGVMHSVEMLAPRGMAHLARGKDGKWEARPGRAPEGVNDALDIWWNKEESPPVAAGPANNGSLTTLPDGRSAVLKAGPYRFDAVARGKRLTLEALPSYEGGILLRNGTPVNLVERSDKAGLYRGADGSWNFGVSERRWWNFFGIGANRVAGRIDQDGTISAGGSAIAFQRDGGDEPVLIRPRLSHRPPAGTGRIQIGKSVFNLELTR